MLHRQWEKLDRAEAEGDFVFWKLQWGKEKNSCEKRGRVSYLGLFFDFGLGQF